MADQIIDRALAYLGNDINARGWKHAGTATGSDSVTVPASAVELYIVANVGATKFTGNLLLPTTTARMELGGYYLTASDYGLCNLNLSNNGRTVAIRNAYYAGTNYKSSSALYVYYKTVE